jgi:hypothetical protein
MSFKRKVFYLSGFDPRGARHYHALYTEQAARYAALAGEDVHVSKRRKGDGPSVRWSVENETAATTTDYVFLGWDDLIRKDWITNPAKLLGAGLRTYRNYLRQIDWKTAFSMQRGPIVTLFYPLITLLAVPLLLALLVFGVGAVWLPWWGALGIAVVCGAAAAFAILNKFKSLWLLRFFIFNDALSEHGVPPALDARLDAFAALVAASFAGDDDEILLVTHSNGSILAVPLMEKLLALTGGDIPAKFALVTLGHCIPLITLRADANRFRQSLIAANAGRYRWIDIGSPPDGAAYTQSDPFKLVGGVKTPQLQMISARIFKFHDPAAYEAKRKDKYEFHFEYLRCGDRLSPIDHPSMTAGPRSLGDAVAAFRRLA